MPRAGGERNRQPLSVVEHLSLVCPTPESRPCALVQESLAALSQGLELGYAAALQGCRSGLRGLGDADHGAKALAPRCQGADGEAARAGGCAQPGCNCAARGLEQWLQSESGWRAMRPQVDRALRSRGTSVASCLCPNGHELVYLGQTRESGWICDGRLAGEGCRGGAETPAASQGRIRFRCEACNFDLCERCHDWRADGEGSGRSLSGGGGSGRSIWRCLQAGKDMMVEAGLSLPSSEDKSTFVEPVQALPFGRRSQLAREGAAPRTTAADEMDRGSAGAADRLATAPRGPGRDWESGQWACHSDRGSESDRDQVAPLPRLVARASRAVGSLLPLPQPDPEGLIPYQVSETSSGAAPASGGPRPAGRRATGGSAGSQEAAGSPVQPHMAELLGRLGDMGALPDMGPAQPQSSLRAGRHPKRPATRKLGVSPSVSWDPQLDPNATAAGFAAGDRVRVRDGALQAWKYGVVTAVSPSLLVLIDGSTTSATWSDVVAVQELTLQRLQGEWLNLDCVWTIEESGRALRDGEYLGPRCDLFQHRTEEGRLRIRRPDGWVVDQDHSTTETITWTKCGDGSVEWRRRRSPTQPSAPSAELSANSAAEDAAAASGFRTLEEALEWIRGRWLAHASDIEVVVTIEDEGRVLYNGAHMGPEKDLVQLRSPSGQILLGRADGWLVEMGKSSGDVMQWTKEGEQRFVWHRMLEPLTLGTLKGIWLATQRGGVPAEVTVSPDGLVLYNGVHRDGFDLEEVDEGAGAEVHTCIRRGDGWRLAAAQSTADLLRWTASGQDVATWRRRLP